METKFPKRILYSEEIAIYEFNPAVIEDFESYDLLLDNNSFKEYISKEEHDAIVQPLIEALEFTIHATEYLYNIKKDLPKGLDPTFYHTLSYEGDMELRDKALKAQLALENYRKQTSKNND